MVLAGWLVWSRVRPAGGGDASNAHAAERSAAPANPPADRPETPQAKKAALVQEPAASKPAAAPIGKSTSSGAALLAEADAARARGKADEEASALSRWIGGVLDFDDQGWQTVQPQAARLAEINRELWFSPAGSFGSTKVDPKPLSKIVKALAAGTPPVAAGIGLIAKMNRLADANNVPGHRKLRVPAESAALVVHKRSRTLELKVGAYVLEVHRIGIGKPSSPSPDGEFEIMEIVKLDHAPRASTLWTRPDDGKQLFYGDPEYPFGARFMRFAPPYEHYGIHGTDTEAAIGGEISHGCVRMRNEESLDLANTIDTLGAARIKVTIR